MPWRATRCALFRADVQSDVSGEPVRATRDRRPVVGSFYKKLGG
ncbi:short-chain type dehydrogenase/reductase domain protein [Mycobacterium xenopi 4042]|uniref:Short-chain type dehydrogenase/reductase domain protein n=1 Tax=Mycobacterium xenopi 4042 TaxID=1299334 RepID=X7YWD0_MYCXE|nr:short-chain type dehydrogenase/reductase domain protein [Mycobacterium xenopi 4042]